MISRSVLMKCLLTGTAREIRRLVYAGPAQPLKQLANAPLIPQAQLRFAVKKFKNSKFRRNLL